jgi:predicted ester cyclase
MRAIDNWDKGDLDGYLQIYDAGVVLHGYIGVEPGLESVKKVYQGFWTNFPGVQLIIDDDVITQEAKFCCMFTIRGTHKDELMGILPTDKYVKFTGITILKFKNGKCIERWSQADFLSMLKQLGAIP